MRKRKDHQMGEAMFSDKGGVSFRDIAGCWVRLGSRVPERWGLLSLVLLVLLAAVPATASATQLVGNSLVEASGDSNIAGQAEAFQFTASASGTMATLMVYVDAS